MIQIDISVRLTEEDLQELADCLGEKLGSCLSLNSVKKAFISFVQKECEDIANDPVSYASQVFMSRTSADFLEPINEHTAIDLAVLNAEIKAEEAAYKRYLDEADYRSLMHSF